MDHIGPKQICMGDLAYKDRVANVEFRKFIKKRYPKYNACVDRKELVEEWRDMLVDDGYSLFDTTTNEVKSSEAFFYYIKWFIENYDRLRKRQQLHQRYRQRRSINGNNDLPYIIISEKELRKKGYFESKTFEDFYNAKGFKSYAFVEWFSVQAKHHKSLRFDEQSYAFTIDDVNEFNKIILPPVFGIEESHPPNPHQRYKALMKLFKDNLFNVEGAPSPDYRTAPIYITHPFIENANLFCDGTTGKASWRWRPGYRLQPIDHVLLNRKGFINCNLYHVSLCPPSHLELYKDRENKKTYIRCIVPSRWIEMKSYPDVTAGNASSNKKEEGSEHSWWGLYPYFAIIFLFKHHGIVFTPSGPSYAAGYDDLLKWLSRGHVSKKDHYYSKEFTLYVNQIKNFEPQSIHPATGVLGTPSLKGFAITSVASTWEHATTFGYDRLRNPAVIKETNGIGFCKKIIQQQQQKEDETVKKTRKRNDTRN